MGVVWRAHAPRLAREVAINVLAAPPAGDAAGIARLERARRARSLDPDDAMLLYNLACIFLLAGLRGEALDVLERLVAAGTNRPRWIRHDSHLAPLRDDARCLAALARPEAAAPSVA